MYLTPLNALTIIHKLASLSQIIGGTVPPIQNIGGGGAPPVPPGIEVPTTFGETTFGELSGHHNYILSTLLL